MRRIVGIMVVLFAVSSAMALPSYYGLQGLNRVVDAQPLEVNQYSVGIFTQGGISNDERTAWLPESGYFDVEDTEYDATGYLAFGYGINEMAEMAGRVSYWWNGYKRDLSNTERDGGTGEWESDDALNEALLSLKLAFNPTDDGQFWLGFMPSVGFGVSSGDNDYVTMYDAGTDGIWWIDDPMFQMRRPMLNSGKMFFGGDMLVSYNADFGLGLHLNAGFHRYSQTFEYTDNRRDMTTGGIIESEDVDLTVDDNVIQVATGIEYQAGAITPFVEMEYKRFLDRDEEAGNGERYDEIAVLDGGFRFVSPYGIALDLTGSMALTSFDPEWSDMGHGIYQATGSVTDEERAARSPFPGGYPADYGIGLNLIFSSVLLEDPTHGTVSGIVTSELTGEVLEAEVSFPASSVLPQTTVEGYYTAELLAGSVPIRVTSEGYLPFTETIVVVAGEDHAFDVQLTPVPDNGVLTGTVTDGETDEVIVGATVMVDGLPEGIEGTTVTNANGVYSIELPEGNWTVKVMAEGYLDVVKVQVMAPEETTLFDVEMRPALEEGQVLSFNNIYFDSGSSNIKPESFPILDNVAQTLIANQGVAVRIAGHTDSDGSASYNQGLSERRAASVRDYLVNKGVPAGSLSTVGYGEEQPVVPNTSASNKAQNRRIEFIILG
ncbi:MAG TPA: OmpA family protein, partial [Candidatus Sabulitectum sp.]|nr:OmpA family protein [Candidatus Sabulitectum sp.]